MRDFGLNDTITAIATPPGEGAIAVVRLSGKEAIKAVDEIFKGKTLLTQIPSGSARYGKIFDKEESEIDEVIVTVMHAPNSYTGEDTVEISCHGGYLPSSKIIKLLTGRGIREAERGEFTLRAFLNNRIDLTKAEAIADMVSSKSELAYNSALKQLSGKLHERIKEEIDKLSGILSTVELGIDFAEEGIELSSRDDIRKSIEDIIYNLKYLIEGYETGRILKDGYRVAITGKVNVGKSSLMNTLLGSERVIVTDIPGTTRDSITESISFNGLEIHLTDTAGFRDRTERIEAEGIKRAADIIAASDLAIVMLDSTTGFTDDDNRVLETASNTKTITALNKKDLFDDAGWERIICSTPISIDISISALTGENLDILKGLVYDSAVGMGDNIGKEIIITNRRHFNCLIGAVDEMQNAAKNIEDDVLFAEHLRLALNHLGEITGEVTTEEILNSIFDNFCIGK